VAGFNEKNDASFAFTIQNVSWKMSLFRKRWKGANRKKALFWGVPQKIIGNCASRGAFCNVTQGIKRFGKANYRKRNDIIIGYNICENIAREEYLFSDKKKRGSQQESSK
jgi:hypothetical protein